MRRESLDAKALDRRWREYQKHSRSVRWLANALVLYLFLLTPTLIVCFGLKLSWLGLLIGLVAIAAATAVLFHRAHKALYPEADDERFTHFIMVLLAPTAAMRAHDILSRPLLESFHPLAAAKVFRNDAQFREFGRKVLIDLRHPALPICPNADAVSQAVESATRGLMQEAVAGFLKQDGVDPDALCCPPARADESCRAYCPRCEAQFTTATGCCSDCGGLPLVAFNS